MHVAQTLESVAPMTQAEARQKTEHVKVTADAIWLALLEIYRRNGHGALGYSSWGEYWSGEFGQSGSRGYQLLDAARVVEVVTAEEDPDEVIQLEVECEPAPAASGSSRRVMRERGPKLPPPSNEVVARRLTATAREDPKRARQVWEQAVAVHGPDATPEQVAEVLRGERSNGDHAAPTPEPAMTDDELVKEAKRCASAMSKAVRKQDPRAAKMALAIWRQTVYRELDKIARTA